MAREAVWKSLVVLKYGKNQEVRTVPSIGKKCRKNTLCKYTFLIVAWYGNGGRILLVSKTLKSMRIYWALDIFI
jgi:hypothetical protein